MTKNQAILDMNSYKTSQTLLVILYFVSFGLMLLNEGLFWDDWTIPTNWADAEWRYLQNKQYFGFLHVYLQNTPCPPLFYRLFSFFLYLFSYLLLLDIAKMSKLDNKNLLYLGIILATIIPYNSARITLICFPYAVGNFFFFFASWLFTMWMVKRIIWLRLAALSMFLLSFIVQSFLFFYIIPVVILLFGSFSLQNRKDLKSLFFTKVTKNIDFILLPFVFKFLIFLIPTNNANGALYANYNKIGIGNIIKFLPNTVLTFIKNTFGCFFEFYKFLLCAPSAMLIIFIALLVFTSNYFSHKGFFKIDKNKNTRFQANNIKSTLFAKIYDYCKGKRFETKLLVVGILLFFIAATPYNLVNKTPSFEGYRTRHQLLMPYGFSLILLSIIRLISHSEKGKRILFSVLVGIFVTTNVFIQLQFNKGWLKQESIMIHFLKNEEIKNQTTFIVLDKSEELDATEREYSFYALNGMAAKVFETENKLFVEYSEYNNNKIRYGWAKLLESAKKFNMEDYELISPNYLIKIDNGDYALTPWNTLKLLIYQKTNKRHFEELLPSLINVEVKKMDIGTINYFLYDK